MIDEKILDCLRGRLIVSCQALPGEPLYGPETMARMALAVSAGGASGIRANGPDDIRAIRAVTSVPVIGLFKDGEEEVYITPTPAHARAVAEAGADLVAIDATGRPRRDGTTLTQLITFIHEELGCGVVADVSTPDEGVFAESAGADIVATTLSGYAPYSMKLDGPDLELVKALAGRLKCPLIAEGRIRTPVEARAALECGAFAVVVGGAITRPLWITEQFIAGIKDA